MILIYIMAFIPFILITLLIFSCIYDYIKNNIKGGITASIIEEMGILTLAGSIIAPLILSVTLLMLF
jgi:hypothetical protein